MKSKTATIAVACALTLVAGACSKNDDKKAAPGPSVTIVSPATGTSAGGNVVSLTLDATGISIVKADGDTTGKTGHFHVFIDRDPVAAGQTIPKEAGIVHSKDNPVVLSGLKIGAHRLVVVFGDGNHTRIGTTQAETSVTLSGPSVDATTSPTAVAGTPVKIEIAVEGLLLVKADGDTTGKTGHVHLFIDRDPTAAGQPIPKEAGIIHTTETSVEIPGLTAGEHTIWVVAGDGNHVPLDPAVKDKVVVTVA